MPHSSHLTRRQFLQASSLLGTTLLFTSCTETNTSPTRTPIVAPKTMTLAWSPNGSQLAWGKENGQISILNQRGQPLPTTYEGHASPISTLTWSPDGQLIASGSHDKTLHVWESQTGKLVTVYKPYSGPVVGIGWTNDSKRIASVDTMAQSIVWHTLGETPSHHPPLTPNKTPKINAASFANNCSQVGYANTDGMLNLDWFINDANDKSQSSCGLRAHVGPGGGALDATWSPNAKYFASCGTDRRITAWQVGTCTNAMEYSNLSYPAQCLAWSPDNTHIAAGVDRAIKLFPFSPEEQPVTTITEHTAPVRAISWSILGQGASIDATQKLLIWQPKV